MRTNRRSLGVARDDKRLIGMTKHSSVIPTEVPACGGNAVEGPAVHSTPAGKCSIRPHRGSSEGPQPSRPFHSPTPAGTSTDQGSG